MLEEHILSLEEDILTKDTEISDLESKLKVRDNNKACILPLLYILTDRLY